MASLLLLAAPPFDVERASSSSSLSSSSSSSSSSSPSSTPTSFAVSAPSVTFPGISNGSGNSSVDCPSKRNRGGLESDIPVILFSAIAIVFNFLIFVTNVNRRRRTGKRLDAVLIQFTLLALTDILASSLMLIHYSTRMSYGTKDKLEDMLNQRFNSSNDPSGGLVINGTKYVSYIAIDFMLIKKASEVCGAIYVRYFTLRWFTEASNRFLLIYMNISRTMHLYKSRTVTRSELKLILILTFYAFVLPGVFMVLIIILILLKAKAKVIMMVAYLATYVMPFFILLVTSILLIKKIHSVDRAVKALQLRSKRTTVALPAVKTRSERNKDQMIIVVIVVTVVYLFTHLPGLVYLVGKSDLWSPSDIVESVLSRVTSVMIAVNSLVNLPLFLFLSDQFLCEFRHLFGCPPPDHRDSVPSTVQGRKTVTELRKYQTRSTAIEEPRPRGTTHVSSSSTLPY